MTLYRSKFSKLPNPNKSSYTVERLLFLLLNNIFLLIRPMYLGLGTTNMFNNKGSMCEPWRYSWRIRNLCKLYLSFYYEIHVLQNFFVSVYDLVYTTWIMRARSGLARLASLPTCTKRSRAHTHWTTTMNQTWVYHSLSMKDIDVVKKILIFF